MWVQSSFPILFQEVKAQKNMDATSIPPTFQVFGPKKRAGKNASHSLSKLSPFCSAHPACMGTNHLESERGRLRIAAPI